MTMNETEETREQPPPGPDGDAQGVHSGARAEIDEFGIPVLTDVLEAEEADGGTAPAPEALQARLSEAVERALPDLPQETVDAAMKRLAPKMETILRKELAKRLPACIDAAVGADPKKE